MASTQLGDQLEKDFNEFTERFVKFTSRAFFLLAAQYMSATNQQKNQVFLNKAWVFEQKMESLYNARAQNHVSMFRYVETGDRYKGEYIDKKLDRQKFNTSLMINGPVQLQKKAKLLSVAVDNLPQIEVMNTLNNVANEATQKTLEMPRENRMERISRDPDTSAWVRVPNGGACDFCMLLASRGPVFKAKTARFSAHGSCKCSASEVYKGYSNSPLIQERADEWLAKNKNRETKARKYQSEEAYVNAGLKKPVSTEYVGRDGVTRTRTQYVLTQKGRDMKAAERLAESDKLAKIKFDKNKPKSRLSKEDAATFEKKYYEKYHKNTEKQDYKSAIFGDY